MCCVRLAAGSGDSYFGRSGVAFFQIQNKKLCVYNVIVL